MKPTPVSPMQAATCAGVSRIFAPSASSTSALPDFDDTERLPCLATRAPAPAATNMAAVEILNVCEASPPVPTTSSRLSGSGTSTRVANSRMTCAAAAISPTVSFLTRRPTVSAAIITGEASPLMILRIMASISSWKISRCSIVRCSASCMVMGMIVPLLNVQKIGQQLVALLRQDGLGMELYALDGRGAVAYTHDLAIVALSGDLEARRQARALDRQRMIAPDRERRSQPGEDPLLAVRGGGEFAVHYAPGAHDPTAEGLPDRLMAEAHAEDRDLASKALDQWDADTR